MKFTISEKEHEVKNVAELHKVLLDNRAFADDVSSINYDSDAALDSHLYKLLCKNTDLSAKYIRAIVYAWELEFRARLSSGEWLHVYVDGLEPISGHFLHTSKKDPNKVAYVADELKGFADVLTVSTLGAYLAKFRENYGLTDRQIERMSHSLQAHKLELKFATAKEDVSACYDLEHYAEASGPPSNASCMRNSEFEEPYPCTVYADHETLAIAYAERYDEIIARTLVRRDTKKYLRPYTMANANSTLTAFESALAAAGYTMDKSMLEGLYLPDIEVTNGSLMMYLDGSCRCVELTEQGWRIGHVGEVTSTDGYVKGKESLRCASCRTLIGANDSYSVNGDDMCEDCADEYSTCEDCDTQILEAQCINDRTVCDSCAQNYSKCADCNEYSTDAGKINGRTVCESCSENYNYCNNCDKQGDETQDIEGQDLCPECEVCRYDVVTCTLNAAALLDGHNVCNDCAASHAKCADCRTYVPNECLNPINGRPTCLNCRENYTLNPVTGVWRLGSPAEKETTCV